jgi:hypothetical protein
MKEPFDCILHHERSMPFCPNDPISEVEVVQTEKPNVYTGSFLDFGID